MFNKNKKNKEEEATVTVNETSNTSDDTILDDMDYSGIDEEDENNKKELKKIEKENKKAEKEQIKKEKQADFDETEEILNTHSKTKAGQTFKMYKFIIKILIFAILLTFGIIMLVYRSEIIGAVYMVTGVVIVFSSLIRMIPLIKTTRSKRARLVTLIQCIIHLVIGAYLILAAFYHWNKLNEYANELADGKIVAKDTLEEKLKEVGAGWAVFNMSAYAYILVAYFFTLSAGYYWVTILYNEPTKKSLFWLMFISNALAVTFALLADKLNAKYLVIAMAIIAILASVVVAGEAGGGYYRYRKALTKAKPKEKAKEATEGKNAPAKDDKIDYTDIDPNTIPVEEPSDDANIVS